MITGGDEWSKYVEKDKIMTAEREDSLSLEELYAAGDQSVELQTGQNVELEPYLVGGSKMQKNLVWISFKANPIPFGYKNYQHKF